jgi:hypothetical protein
LLLFLANQALNFQLLNAWFLENARLGNDAAAKLWQTTSLLLLKLGLLFDTLKVHDGLTAW